MFRNTRTRLISLARRSGTQVVAAGAVVLVATQQAHAALPQDVQNAYTAVGTSVSDHSSAAWPIVILTTVALVSIGIFKKFIYKSAS